MRPPRPSLDLKYPKVTVTPPRPSLDLKHPEAPVQRPRLPLDLKHPSATVKPPRSPLEQVRNRVPEWREAPPPRQAACPVPRHAARSGQRAPGPLRQRTTPENRARRPGARCARRDDGWRARPHEPAPRNLRARTRVRRGPGDVARAPPPRATVRMGDPRERRPTPPRAAGAGHCSAHARAPAAPHPQRTLLAPRPSMAPWPSRVPRATAAGRSRTRAAAARPPPMTCGEP